jgi:putative ABC transport system permease protein
MSYILKLAIKNVTRAKRRTILTFLMLSFGVAIYILMAGLLEGFDRNTFRNTIEFETGHFKIRKEGFNRDRPYDVENIIREPGKVRTVLKNDPEVTGYTGRLQFIGEIDNGIDSTPILAVGVNPRRDKTVFALDRYIYEGGFEEGGVILGKDLAEDLKLRMGDVAYITFRNEQGMMTSLQFYLSGLINTPYAQVNRATAFILLKEAKAGMNVDGVTDFSVTLDVDPRNSDRLSRMMEDIEKKLPGYTLVPWDRQVEDLQALTQVKKKATSIFLLFILVIGGVGIVNTMLISVLEKRREIGTLKALGMEDSQVRNLFVFEGLVIGVMGSLFGLVLGSILNIYFAVHGIDYSGMAGMEYSFMGVMKSTWPFVAYIQAFFLATLASVLASYYPAKKVMDMQPVECLRTVQ